MTSQIEWVQTDPLLTKPQAAEYLSMSLRMIDRLISQRQIAVVHIGRAVRIRRSELDSYIQAHTAPAGRLS